MSNESILREALKKIRGEYKSDHYAHRIASEALVEAMTATPVDNNFCPRCGKRAGVHTCTPPGAPEHPKLIGYADPKILAMLDDDTIRGIGPLIMKESSGSNTIALYLAAPPAPQQREDKDALPNVIRLSDACAMYEIGAEDGRPELGMLRAFKYLRNAASNDASEELK